MSVEIIKKKIARPGGAVKNAHKVPTKREFTNKYRSAAYRGKDKTWFMNEEDYLRYIKNPVKDWKVECTSLAL